MRYLPLLFCLLFVTGCDESPTGPSSPLNTDFVLAPGSTATIEGASLSIRFDRVSGDSRCPADAFCIQGGDAIVHVTATSDRRARQYELHTGSMQPVQHDDIIITLVQLSPYPFSSRTIAPGEYRATLRVAR
jgi:hypothetical protein